MKQDTKQTKMIFRKDRFGVFALMPYEIADRQGNVTCYQHIGQHSAANYWYCIQYSKPANQDEAKDLFNELTQIGYNIKLIKRQNFNKYLKANKATN